MLRLHFPRHHYGYVILEGWNHVPAGFAAEFELVGAPWWLRAWFVTPFVDRFAYPVIVRRGHGRLIAHPGVAPSSHVEAEALRAGWRIASGSDADDMHSEGTVLQTMNARESRKRRRRRRLP